MGNPPFSVVHILTFTGKKFHLLSPSPDEIVIEDIAHHLSMLCRFTGACSRFYSVAEHSIHASNIVSPEFSLEALLHDASESYLNDWNRPFKHLTVAGEHYQEMEKIIQSAIQEKFGLPAGMSPAVKDADNKMLYAEKAVLMPKVSWGTKWSETEEAADVDISCWAPGVSEAFFLERFHELNRAI